MLATINKFIDRVAEIPLVPLAAPVETKAAATAPANGGGDYQVTAA
jgi:hypothetical protein